LHRDVILPVWGRFCPKVTLFVPPKVVFETVFGFDSIPKASFEFEVHRPTADVCPKLQCVVFEVCTPHPTIARLIPSRALIRAVVVVCPSGDRVMNICWT